MRLALLTLFILSAAPSFADERLEARIGPDTQKTPNLAAATAPHKAKGVWSFPGSWNVAYEADSGISGAPENLRFSDGFRQRFRAGARYDSAKLKGSLSFSIYDFDSISPKDASKTETTAAALRHAYLELLSPVGLWRLGATESRWGLGIVAGGRSAYQGLTHDFTFRKPSDTAAGLTYAAKVGKLTAGLSGAYVLSDENANLLAGDRAQQAVAVLRYRPKANNWVGMYSAYRRQKDADGSFLRALLLDLAGSFEGIVGASDRWRFAFEAAYLLGDTDRSLSESVFAQGQDSMSVSAFGGAAIAGFETMNRRLAIELEGGYASADRNPENDDLSRFTFDDNFGVGMILIPGLLRLSHEASVARASDPDRVGIAQHGLARLKSEGRVAGAVYLNPRISYRIGSGKSKSGVHLGLVVAGLPDGSADPYMSFRRGEPSNAFGQPSAHDLGIELNAGLSWSAKLQRRYALRLSLDGAAAQPGAALAAAEPKPIFALRTGFTLRALEKESK